MFSRGDPELDRELQSEIGKRGRWKRDVLLLLGGILLMAAIVLLAGVGAEPTEARAELLLPPEGSSVSFVPA